MTSPSRPAPNNPAANAYDAGDARLNQLLRRTPLRCASLTEYSNAAGIPVAAVVTAFGGLLDRGAAGLETVNGEVFLRTGLRRPHCDADVPPNLWEILRNQHPKPEVAYYRWRLLRALERAGWRTEVDLAVVMAELGHVRQPATLGLKIGDQTIPLLDPITADEIRDAAGPISDWVRAGVPVIALACPAGQLDSFVTAARIHFNAARGQRIQLVVIEEPSYNAVVLDSTDPRVVATEISKFYPGGRPHDM